LQSIQSGWPLNSGIVVLKTGLVARGPYFATTELLKFIREENNQNGEFIWEDDDKGFGEDYSQEERTKMEEIYANTLTEITEKEVVKGTIVGINDRDIILNIGFKSDGLVSAAEFRDIPDLKIGDEVEVFIEKQEDANGQLILSRRPK